MKDCGPHPQIKVGEVVDVVLRSYVDMSALRRNDKERDGGGVDKLKESGK